MWLVVVNDHICNLVPLSSDNYDMIVYMFLSYFSVIDDKNELRLYDIILLFQCEVEFDDIKEL